MDNWKDVVITPQTPLGDAIAKIDASSLQVALALHPDGTLAGVLTDGDIRRVILRGQGLQIPVSEAMNSTPTSVPASMSRDAMLELMRPAFQK
ncbi:MAG TPA: CBS domain-containing protein [Nitrospirales bacterium]|nr:CBS domain-containing protein [Nitrospirales bacterium]